MQKRIAIIALIVVGSIFYASAQTAGDYFNRAANEYLYQNEQVALNTIDMGLKSFPNDPPLTKLKEKILKDKQQQKNQQQDQQNQDQQKQKEEEQNKQNQEQEQQQGQDEQQQQDEQQSEESEDAEKKQQPQQAEQQETEEEGQEMDQPPQSREEKLEELNLTEEKARMILEALKNKEIQYIQQNRRKPTKKPDNAKPDW